MHSYIYIILEKDSRTEIVEAIRAFTHSDDADAFILNCESKDDSGWYGYKKNIIKLNGEPLAIY